MARRKRKTPSSAASAHSRGAAPSASASAGPGGFGAGGKFGAAGVGLPLLCAAALVLAYVAALAGVAPGNPDSRGLGAFNSDAVPFPWFVFRDIFLSDAWPASGWRRNVSPFDFPETAALWALWGVFGDIRAGLWLAPAVYISLSAGGWMLVCDALYGKSPARRAAVILLHIPALLTLAWRGPDVFSPQLWVNFRHGTWTVLPWLVWLLLRAMENFPRGKGPLRGRGRLAALAAALAVMVESDPAVLPWFVAPALFSLACVVWLKKMRGAEFARIAAACGAGVAGGFLLRKIPPFQPHRSEGEYLGFNADQMAYAFSNLVAETSDLAARNIPEAAAWLAFVAVALWRLADVFRPAKKSAGGLPRALFGASGPGDSRTRLFMAVFVPASAAACVAAVLATGNFHQNYWRDNLAPALRYLYPAVYFPLFVGWALLPWDAPLFRKNGRALAAGFAVLALLLAAPRAMSFSVAAADPFNSPLQKCFAENARRLGWKGGIATWFFSLPFAANPESGAERMMPVGVLRRGAGESLLYLDWQVSNRHWFAGEFQFVVLNMFNGRAFGLPPEAGDLGCPAEEPSPCVPEGHGALFLDEAAARGALGEPAEVVECAGVGFYHYDPPLRFDLPENPDFARVGRGF